MEPAGEQQTGDIAAGDQEHERYRAQQRYQQSATFVIQLVLHQQDLGRDSFQVRICLCVPAGQRRYLRLGLLQHGSIPQPGYRIPTPVLGPRLVRSHGQPEIHEGVDVVVGFARGGRIRQKTHAGWHHTHHRERRRLAADVNWFANNIRVAIETPLPKIVPENDRRGRRIRGRDFRFREFVTEHRLDPEHLEKVFGHNHSAERFAPVRQHQKVKSPTVQRRRLEGLACFPPFQPLPDSASLLVSATVDSGRRHENEPARFGIRRRRQQNPLNQAEHGRRRSNPKPKGEHSHGREAGVLEQLAEGVFQIGHGSLKALKGLNR